mgnify:CR=1 FL=1
MDRLTKYSNETSHKNGVCCTHFLSDECRALGGECAHGCKWEEAAWERLAAYEDTGLTPQEVLSMKFEWCAMMDALNSIGGGYTRLRELAEADRDGRLVVLPCKVGDTVWVTGRDNVPREMELEAPDIRAVCTDEDNLCMSTCNRKPDGFCAYRLRNDGADIGKTVFLTREEAEKALEATKDE